MTAAPKPKQVYDTPDAYWTFVTATTDVSFESQHFDRKEAGRPEADGTVHNAKLNGVRNQIEECVSAFANATGGLLVLGVSSAGVVPGLKHLDESQLNSMLKLDRLVHHGCQVRLHDVINAQGAPDRVALFSFRPVTAQFVKRCTHQPNPGFVRGFRISRCPMLLATA